MEQFEKRMEFFEKLGEIIVSPDVVDAMSDAGFDHDADSLRTMVTSFYARNWLRKNDVETDLFDMFTDDARPDVVKGISDDVQSIAKTLQQLGKRAEGKVNTVVEGAEEEEQSDMGSSDEMSDEGMEGEGGDDMMSDEDGMGDDDFDSEGGSDGGSDGDSDDFSFDEDADGGSDGDLDGEDDEAQSDEGEVEEEPEEEPEEEEPEE